MKKETCPECERGILKRKDVPYFLYGDKVGDFDGEVCNVCKAEFFNEKQEEFIEKRIKQLGLWGLETEAKVRQSGNSLSITLPKKVREFLNVRKGKEVVMVPIDRHTLQVKV